MEEGKKRIKIKIYRVEFGRYLMEYNQDQCNLFVEVIGYTSCTKVIGIT